MLKEVLEFTNQEAAAILRVSEPVFRHRLSDARAKMTHAFDGLCALINKTGVCYQCQGLREIAGEKKSRREPGPNRSSARCRSESGNLFDARTAIVRDGDLESGTTRQMHDMFYQNLSRREESAANLDFALGL